MNVSESSDQPKSGKQMLYHLREIHKYIYVENLISNIYLVAFNRHDGQCTIAINESISHS